jgi:hypothetical protein
MAARRTMTKTKMTREGGAQYRIVLERGGEAKVPYDACAALNSQSHGVQWATSMAAAAKHEGARLGG